MEFFYSSLFKKQFKKIPPNLQRHIGERLVLFAEDEFQPQLNNHPLQGKYKDYRSINITGDWRLLYKRVSNEAVYIALIGTHSELYE